MNILTAKFDSDSEEDADYVPAEPSTSLLFDLFRAEKADLRKRRVSVSLTL